MIAQQLPIVSRYNYNLIKHDYVMCVGDLYNELENGYKMKHKFPKKKIGLLSAEIQNFLFIFSHEYLSF